jgi:hypothetical protein
MRGVVDEDLRVRPFEGDLEFLRLGPGVERTRDETDLLRREVELEHLVPVP